MKGFVFVTGDQILLNLNGLQVVKLAFYSFSTNQYSVFVASISFNRDAWRHHEKWPVMHVIYCRTANSWGKFNTHSPIHTLTNSTIKYCIWLKKLLSLEIVVFLERTRGLCVVWFSTLIADYLITRNLRLLYFLLNSLYLKKSIQVFKPESIIIRQSPHLFLSISMVWSSAFSHPSKRNWVSGKPILWMVRGRHSWLSFIGPVWHHWKSH